MMEADQLLRHFSDAHHIHLSSSWLQRCLAQLPPQQQQQPAVVEAVAERFLSSDLKESAAQGGCLPAGVSAMHKLCLQGSFVLQVQRAFNIAEFAEFRTQVGRLAGL